MKVTRPDQKPHMFSYFMFKNHRLLKLDVLSSYKLLACNRFISYRNRQKFEEQEDYFIRRFKELYIKYKDEKVMELNATLCM